MLSSHQTSAEFRQSFLTRSFGRLHIYQVCVTALNAPLVLITTFSVPRRSIEATLNFLESHINSKASENNQKHRKATIHTSTKKVKAESLAKNFNHDCLRPTKESYLVLQMRSSPCHHHRRSNFKLQLPLPKLCCGGEIHRQQNE